MTFNESVKFYGTYRPYQQRVLDNLVAFLDNEKIHIVAAPGSGKTILGLELIKRLDNPALILAPSIAIREQWIERFVNGFLNNKDSARRKELESLKNIEDTLILYEAPHRINKKTIVIKWHRTYS